MSDTVKLVIEIPKEVFEARKVGEISPWVTTPILDSVQNGIPLDDVKLKIEQDMSLDMFDDYGNETAIHKELWEIFDNIGKGNEECQE